MNKRLIALLSILFLSLSALPIPANAIENGESALNDPRILSMYGANPNNLDNLTPGCSAWLYAPRLVFTVGHCMYDQSQKPNKVLQSTLVTFAGKPGTPTTYGLRVSQVRASKIFVYDTFEWYSATPGGTLSFKDDFAVVVLEKPIANVEVASLATKQFLDDLISKRQFIETGGYGYQDNSRQDKPGIEPRKARFQLITFEEGMRTVNEFKQKWNRTYFQEDAVFVKLPKNGAAPCDKDSGSGYFYNDNGKSIYLGIAMGPQGSPNCGLEPWTDIAVGAFRPVYLDVDLVKLAEKYVTDNPYVEPKIWNGGSNNKIIITCVKGKVTKKIIGITPKCPIGYKKK